MNDEDATLTVGSPMQRVPRPTSVALPPAPERPVNVHVEIDDERGCRVQFDIDLPAEHADNVDRLASVLLRGVHDVGAAYLAAAWSGAPEGDRTLVEHWRVVVADRAAQL